MRYLTTSVAILAIAAASLARAQDGAGLRNALEAAQSDTSRLQEAIAAQDGDADAPAPALASEEELDQLVAPGRRTVSRSRRCSPIFRIRRVTATGRGWTAS